jgi:hypothetical protein
MSVFLVGLLALAILHFKRSENSHYVLQVRFADIEVLPIGTDVRVAGAKVGWSLRKMLIRAAASPLWDSMYLATLSCRWTVPPRLPVRESSGVK